jgi:hypothetical protein
MVYSVKALFASRSRKILITTAIIVGVLSVGVYGYLVSLPFPAGPSVTLTSPPFEFSTGLDKTEYTTSDNLTMYFSLRNISNKTVTVTETSGYSLGVAPDVRGIKLSTSAKGVSTSPDIYDLNYMFHFYFSWVESNGTVIFDTRNLIRYADVYDIVLEPNGCLNQTLSISIADNYYLGISGQPSLVGVFQIQGFFYEPYIDVGSTVTLETPGIAFAIN